MDLDSVVTRRYRITGPRLESDLQDAARPVRARALTGLPNWSSCSSRISMLGPGEKRRENIDPNATLSTRLHILPRRQLLDAQVHKNGLHLTPKRPSSGWRAEAVLRAHGDVPDRGGGDLLPIEKVSVLKNASILRANAARTTATNAYNGQRRSVPLVVGLGSTLILPPALPHLSQEFPWKPRLRVPRTASGGTASGGTASTRVAWRRCAGRVRSPGPEAPPSTRRERRIESPPPPPTTSTRGTFGPDQRGGRRRGARSPRFPERAATHLEKRPLRSHRSSPRPERDPSLSRRPRAAGRARRISCAAPATNGR